MMTAETENLVLEHLRGLRSDMADLREGLRDLRNRHNDTQALVVSLKADSGLSAMITAHVQVQVDTLRERMERVERRLELRDR